MTKLTKFRSHFLLIILVIVCVLGIGVLVNSNDKANADTITYWSDTDIASTSINGGGIQNNPYIISSAKDLGYVYNQINAGNMSGSYFKLSANIDMSGHNFEPLAKGKTFSGNFDGNFYVIYNLKINSTTDNIGLFAKTSNNTTIKNLGLHSGSIIGANNVGSIVGDNGGSISQCFSTVKVEAIGSNVGGIAGNNSGNILDVSYKGNIIGNHTIGGLVGHISSGKIANSFAMASAKASAGNTAGAIIGNGSVNFLEKNFYNKDLASATDISDKQIGLTTQDMTGTNALNKLAINSNVIEKQVWTAKLPNTEGQTVIPVLKGFYSKEGNLNSYAIESVTDRFYGIASVDNLTEWGKSDTNPYLISNATQLRNIQKYTKEYSYEKSFFKLSNDLDLENSSLEPIGSYFSNIDNKPFNGKFDGSQCSITNFSIKKSEDTFVGLFSYIGNLGSVSNLKIDNANVNGHLKVAVVAGKNNGTIDNVSITNATVAGQESAVIASENNGKISNIYCELADGSSVNGVISASNPAGTGNFTNAWCATRNLAYRHNKLGSVMYFDKNITAFSNMLNLANKTVTISATDIKSGYTVEYRTSDESVLSRGDSFSPSGQSSNSYYARAVRDLAIKGVDNNATLTGKTTYYDGQDVNLRLSINNGKYLYSIDNDCTIKMNPDKSLTINYKMPSDTTLNPISLIFKEITFVEPASYTYESKNKIFTISNTPDAICDFTTSFSYFNNTKNMVVDGAKDVAVYKVTVYFNIDNIQIGYKTFDFTITKFQLVLDGGALVTTKQYDNKDTSSASIDQSKNNKFENDIVTILGSGVYSAKALGDTTATFTFTLSGENANNYSAPVKKENVVVTIIKRETNLTIEEKYLTKIFDGKIITIEEYSVEGIIGSAFNIKFTYEKSDNTADLIGQGTYNIKVTTDNAYHNVSLKREYKFVITQKEVDIIFSNFTGLKYTGSQQGIVAKYVDVNGNHIDASLSYKNIDDQLIIDQINAGSYLATATILDTNYIIKATSTNTQQFTIEKANQVQDLSIVNPYSTEPTYGDSAVTLTAKGGSGDGAYTYFVKSGHATIVESLLTLTGAGQIIIYAIRAESANYLSATSSDLELSVNYVDLTVKVSSLTIDYSDSIVFQFTFDGFIPQDINLQQPKGFVKPTLRLNNILYVDGSNYDVGDYILQMTAGSSDGYSLKYDHSNNPMFKVEKKSITITADNINVDYGHIEEPLTYTTSVITLILNGQLTREVGVDAADYIISQGSLTNENNTNFNISFEGGVYRIKAVKLTITMDKKEKIFGATDPEVSYSVSGLTNSDSIQKAIINDRILRAVGENAYKNDIAGGATYLYDGSQIELSSNYTLVFVTATLTILPAEPIFTSEHQGSDIQYGDKLSSSLPILGASNVSGTVKWSSPDTVPKLIEGSTASYEAIFTPTSLNYKKINIIVPIKIIKRNLTVVFTGEQNLIYNGLSQRTIEYKILNLLDDDIILDKLTYSSADMILAGSYKATVSIDNANYQISNDNVAKIVIKSAPLLIWIDNIIINQGEVPQAVYHYDGFVNSENIEVLTTLPKIDYPTASGKFYIKPYGAVAANYDISYNQATMFVAKTIINEPKSDITLTGKFDPTTEFTFVELLKNENKELFDSFSNILESYKTSTNTLKGTKIIRFYDYSLTVDDRDIEPLTSIKVRVLIPSKLRQTKTINIAVFNKDSMTMVNNVKRDGDYVEFETSQAITNLAFVAKPDYTWIFLCAIGVIIFMLILSLDMISEKMGLGKYSEKKKAKKLEKESLNSQKEEFKSIKESYKTKT